MLRVLKRLVSVMTLGLISGREHTTQVRGSMSSAWFTIRCRTQVYVHPNLHVENNIGESKTIDGDLHEHCEL